MDIAKLRTLLKKQKFNAIFQLIFILLWIFVFIFSRYYTIKFNFYGFSNHAVHYSGNYSFWLFTDLSLWVPFFVLWVLGIINAVKINSITKESTLLIVFAVISLVIGHLIVAIIEQRKYQGEDLLYTNKFRDTYNHPQNNNSNKQKDDRYAALDEALDSGIINSEEYKRKKADIKKKEVLEEMENSSKR